MSYLDQTQRFALTENHLRLLRRANVCFSDMLEYGAPAIDPKRPYGNSLVAKDISEILGWDWPDEDEVSPSEYDRRCEQLEVRARTIHEQTATALQIVLATGSFEPGLYEKPRYGGQWKPVAEVRA